MDINHDSWREHPQSTENVERTKNELRILSSFSSMFFITVCYNAIVEQGKRYEHYRSSKLNHKAVKSLLTHVMGSKGGADNIHDINSVLIALAGVGKLFAGQIVEESCKVRFNNEGTTDLNTPLTPSDFKKGYFSLMLEER